MWKRPRQGAPAKPRLGRDLRGAQGPIQGSGESLEDSWGGSPAPPPSVADSSPAPGPGPE